MARPDWNYPGKGQQHARAHAAPLQAGAHGARLRAGAHGAQSRGQMAEHACSSQLSDCGTRIRETEHIQRLLRRRI